MNHGLSTDTLTVKILLVHVVPEIWTLNSLLSLWQPFPVYGVHTTEDGHGSAWAAVQ